jgi:hypothetical protein
MVQKVNVSHDKLTDGQDGEREVLTLRSSYKVAVLMAGVVRGARVNVDGKKKKKKKKKKSEEEAKSN